MNDELSTAGHQANADYYRAVMRSMQEKHESVESLFLDEVQILTTPKDDHEH